MDTTAHCLSFCTSLQDIGRAACVNRQWRAAADRTLCHVRALYLQLSDGLLARLPNVIIDKLCLHLIGLKLSGWLTDKTVRAKAQCTKLIRAPRLRHLDLLDIPWFSSAVARDDLWPSDENKRMLSIKTHQLVLSISEWLQTHGQHLRTLQCRAMQPLAYVPPRLQSLSLTFPVLQSAADLVRMITPALRHLRIGTGSMPWPDWVRLPFVHKALASLTFFSCQTGISAVQISVLIDRQTKTVEARQPDGPSYATLYDLVSRNDKTMCTSLSLGGQEFGKQTCMQWVTGFCSLVSISLSDMTLSVAMMLLTLSVDCQKTIQYVIVDATDYRSEWLRAMELWSRRCVKTLRSIRLTMRGNQSAFTTFTVEVRDSTSLFRRVPALEWVRLLGPDGQAIQASAPLGLARPCDAV